jgi:hypothetical protein
MRIPCEVREHVVLPVRNAVCKSESSSLQRLAEERGKYLTCVYSFGEQCNFPNCCPNTSNCRPDLPGYCCPKTAETCGGKFCADAGAVCCTAHACPAGSVCNEVGGFKQCCKPGAVLCPNACKYRGQVAGGNAGDGSG